MKKLLLSCSLFSLVGQVGCGLFGGTKEEIVLPAPPKIVKEVPKPAPRAPGSLWAEDSRWNEIYTFIPARKVGDTVLIKVTDTLKFRIDQSLRAKAPAAKKEPEKIAQGPARPTDPDSAEAKPEFNDGVAKAAPPKQASKNDTTELEGTILEILSRGVYRVYANKAMSIGTGTPYVIVDAHLRERDITADDSTSSEALFNLKVDATNFKAGTEIRQEGK